MHWGSRRTHKSGSVWGVECSGGVCRLERRTGTRDDTTRVRVGHLIGLAPTGRSRLALGTDEGPHAGVQMCAVLRREKAPVFAAHFAATARAPAAALEGALEAKREEPVVHRHLFVYTNKVQESTFTVDIEYDHMAPHRKETKSNSEKFYEMKTLKSENL